MCRLFFYASKSQSFIHQVRILSTINSERWIIQYLAKSQSFIHQVRILSFRSVCVFNKGGKKMKVAILYSSSQNSLPGLSSEASEKLKS